MLPQAQDDEKLIEVFDVLIKTQNRLVIKEGDVDIHCSTDYIDLAESILNTANFHHRMQSENEEGEQHIEGDDENEHRPVYDLSSVQ